MRVPVAFFLALFVVLWQGTFVHAQTTPVNTFTTNLFVGSSGVQVVALQQLLNRDPDTRISATGIGSPGQESSYFGLLTKAAVIRFQQKYRSETLTPAGLVQASGFVGSYTRAKLNLLLASTPTVSSTQPGTTPVTGSITTTASSNPNLKNVDTFLAAVEKRATAEGTPAATIATMKAQILKDVATTTDLQATFVGIVQKNSAPTAFDTSFPGKILATITDDVSSFFAPKARAAGLPFGGPLLFAFFCNCSFNWLITIGPLPPTYVTLLSYYPGSQAYLSYNIPATRWLLGEYAPGGACLIFVPHGCMPLPTEGLITPTVGSSGLSI